MTEIVFQEVAMRDGLQIEPAWIPTDEKVRLLDALSKLGFSRIEVSSFVSPTAVPALRDADEVFRRIRRSPAVVYVALVPNLRGAHRAIAAGADELNLVVSSGETHNLANMRMTVAESYGQFAAIARETPASTKLNGTVATAFGCPFEGEQPVARIHDMVRRFLDLGVGGITLADTTGMADPLQVERLVAEVLALTGPEALTLHFHNTRGLGLANLLAAYRAGARRFDAALGGLGGCPFAPGASGNICTEDAVAMADRMGMAYGIDLRGLLAVARELPPLIGHELPGQVMKAGLVTDLHEAPEAMARHGQHA